MRINKLFSNYGICSRKETNKLIEERRVKVNGEFCVLGQWVEEGKDEILFDGKPISIKKKVYIALNKPIGITCTAKNEINHNIIKFMNYPEYIFPVGRLDKESQGLILMTNDGELANRILESENMHEKEYIVKVNKAFDDKFLKQMAEGVEITGYGSSGIKRISDEFGVCKIKDNEKTEFKAENLEPLKVVQLADLKQTKMNVNKVIKTRKCKVYRIDENTFKIILTQGLNRQIRKMCGALGYKVIKLERIRIINIKISDIEIGKWREINEEEVMVLKKELLI
ncbi:ribosomal large subunit pseudouridine synthase F [Clostridium puniceum]|uniref:Pseudouridine synthase n=1 Tax=Clostridium puniceum TaxID=29367 RepID=A0A1S8T9V3_9CLOT|nr:RNA pseudouridine synthase [Clostridium puniceum]OOM74518.1 ribosomal large subunit pseudouridine synthase F [Clostridium puniceum]